MKARAIWIGVAATVAAVGLVAGFVWWKAGQRREILAAAIPEIPEVASWPGEFQQRLDACVLRIANGEDPIAALGELSSLYHANGFYDEARQCYEGLEQLDPDEPRWPHRHAAILAGYGESDAAIPRWRRVADLAPDYIPAQLRLGDLLLKTGLLGEAEDLYAAIQKRKPNEAYAPLGLARCEIERGDWEKARVHLERATQLSNFKLGYDLIVTCYERLGMKERADSIRGLARTFDTYRDPPDPWVDAINDDCYDLYRLSLIAGRELGAGNAASAIRRLERALVFSGDNVTLDFQLGMTLFGLKEYTKSRKYFEKCIEIAPDFPDGWIQLANLLQAVGDGTAANAIVERGIANCPDSPGLHLLRGRRLKAEGRIPEALLDFQRAGQLRPNEAAAFIEAAVVLFALQREAEGMAEMEKALRAEPDHPTVLSTFAFQAISSGDKAGAQEWLKRAKNQPRIQSEDLARLTDAFAAKFGAPFK